MRLRGSPLVMTLYILFLLIPIYWLVNMSFKTNTEITSTFTLFPMDFTVQNYVTILTDPSWYMGYVNSIIVGGRHRTVVLGRTKVDVQFAQIRKY